MTAAFDAFVLAGATILAWTVGVAISPAALGHDAALQFIGIQFLCLAFLYLIGAYVSTQQAQPRSLYAVPRLLLTIAGAIALSRHYWLDERFWGFAGLTALITMAGGGVFYSPVFARMCARMHVSDRARAARTGVVAVLGEEDATSERWRSELEEKLGSLFTFVHIPLRSPSLHGRAVVDAAERDRCVEHILQFMSCSGTAQILIVPGASPRLCDIATELKLRGCDVAGGEVFLERQLRAIEPSDTYNTYWVLHCSARRAAIWRIAKRAFDVAIAVVLFFVTLPTLIVSAAAIRLSSPGPILYRQMRVGLNGRPFVIYKLRSMRTDAEAHQKPQWASQRDPRTTPVGRWLRQYRIDELPQLFNILKGDMSFVGPRPERPEFVDLLTVHLPCYRIRHAVKPGLTGWAQINYPYGASVEDARRKLSFDLFYVERAGLLFDIFIIMRTLRVVVLGQGAR